MFNNKEKIKAIEEYIKYFPRDYIANDNLLLCTYAGQPPTHLKVRGL